jgi:hypothetical protein
MLFLCTDAMYAEHLHYLYLFKDGLQAVDLEVFKMRTSVPSEHTRTREDTAHYWSVMFAACGRESDLGMLYLIPGSRSMFYIPVLGRYLRLILRPFQWTIQREPERPP